MSKQQGECSDDRWDGGLSRGVAVQSRALPFVWAGRIGRPMGCAAVGVGSTAGGGGFDDGFGIEAAAASDGGEDTGEKEL